MVRLIGSLCVAVFVPSALSCSLKNPSRCKASPVVPTGAGPVQGFDRRIDGQLVSSFLAIPFAEPPVGALRFHYPVESSATWTTPRRNLTKAPPCMQYSGNGDEDCLYLNVYAPRKAIGAESTLPVMFWIYGGAYRQGDAFGMPGGPGVVAYAYDGGKLASRHDTVIVTHNYRLDALGFNTYTTGAGGETGTQAMEDQRFALRWTRDNIRAFGGAADRVTIFGESAGAFSVVYHLVSPPSWQYFSGAIVESGVSWLSWFFQPRELAADLYQSWAAALGCSDLPCLQALPAAAMTKPPAGLSGRSPSFPTFSHGPVIDGTTQGLLDVPAALVRAGKHHRVPLIIGSNQNEGSIFEPLVSALVPGADPEALSQRDVDLILDWAFTKEDQAKIRAVYSADDYGRKSPARYYRLVARLMRDVSFACSDRLIARKWRDAGLDAFVYTQSFDFGDLETSLPLGDFHASELAFVWRVLLDLLKPLPTAGAVQEMADIVSCQWATFAHAGAPSSRSASVRNCERVHGKVNDWPRFTEEEFYYSLQALRNGSGPKIGQLRANNKYPDDERPSHSMCDMWETVSFPWHNKTAAIVI